MGKYILLLTFSVGLGLAYYAQQSQQTSVAASKDQAERQETVLARQIARSAFDKGLSEVKRNFSSISGSYEEEGSYEKGSYTVTYNAGTDEGEKVVPIEARGTYRGATYQISGTAREKVVMPGLFSGITADDDIDFVGSDGKGCSGLACILGNTENGDDRPGMNLPGSMDLDDSGCPENWNPEDIEGGPEETLNECGLHSRKETSSSWLSDKMKEIKKELQKHGYDSKCNGGCEIKGNDEGSGVMYVPSGESLEIKGTSTWNGIVYVAEGGDVTIKGGGGKGSGGSGKNNRNINGALLMEGHLKDDEGNIEDPSEFDMSGGNRVQYDPDEIDDYINNMSSYNEEITEVTITDRVSCVLPDGSEQCPTAED